MIENSMLEYLFGSKTRLKLLRLFFRDPLASFYVRELTRLLDIQINAVRRELELLIQSGLVKEIEQAHPVDSGKAGVNLRKYYALNTESILYPEMHALLIKAQVLGEQKFVKEMQEKGGDIVFFLMTRKFTNEKRAKTDMLLVGKLKEQTIAKIIARYEKEFGFEILYTTMSEQEFFDRRHMMDKFLFSLFEGEHVKVANRLRI